MRNDFFTEALANLHKHVQDQSPLDVVNDEGLTRLEAAVLERDELIKAEMNRHRDNLDAELSRHRDVLKHIDHVFKLRLGLKQ